MSEISKTSHLSSAAQLPSLAEQGKADVESRKSSLEHAPRARLSSGSWISEALTSAKSPVRAHSGAGSRQPSEARGKAGGSLSDKGARVGSRTEARKSIRALSAKPPEPLQSRSAALRAQRTTKAPEAKKTEKKTAASEADLKDEVDEIKPLDVAEGEILEQPQSAETAETQDNSKTFEEEGSRRNTTTTVKEGREKQNELQQLCNPQIDKLKLVVRQGGQAASAAKEKIKLYRAALRGAENLLGRCEEESITILSRDEKDSLLGSFEVMCSVLDRDYTLKLLKHF